MSFVEASDPGADPFTAPVDIKGPKAVKVGGPETGEGPFGGSGSDLVCDRDLLFSSLAADPQKRKEWARVLGINPSLKSVKKYIAVLHPVTLTRDTRVTNHTFTDGKAVSLQSILQAGTTVLVDKQGRPVVRCRCGNPLQPAVAISEAECVDCPPDYTPPEQCNFKGAKPQHGEIYSGKYYSNASYDKAFVRSGGAQFSDCYTPYPKPPKVTFVNVYKPPPEPEPEPEPAPPPVESAPAPAPAPESSCPPGQTFYEGAGCQPTEAGLSEEAAPEDEGLPPAPPECPGFPPGTFYDPGSGCVHPE